MSAFNESDWTQLRLVKELRRTRAGKREWGDVVKAATHLAPLLSWRPPGLEEFTDHDLEHSRWVLASIGDILPEEHGLNKLEVLILLYAALYHDLGMWTRSGEVMPALDDAEFLRFCDGRHKDELAKARSLLDEGGEAARAAGKLLLRQLVADWNRETHPERVAAELREESHAEAIVPSVIPENIRECVALVIEAHNWPTEQLLSDACLTQRAAGTTGDNAQDWVNVRFLASLLRLGDLLDLDGRRISSLVRAYLGRLSPTAAAHWHKHECLRLAQPLSPDEIKVTGEFDYDSYGPVAADAHSLALDWLDWLDDEARALVTMCNHPGEYGLNDRPRVGRLVTHGASYVVSKGLIFSRNLEFRLDRDRIMELLGDQIYQGGSIFVRELLQNAMDATRLQMVRDYRGESGPERKAKFGDRTLDLHTPMCWPHEITGHDDYEITVNTGKELLTPEGGGDAVECITFEVIDRGIGMTPQQVQDHFLQIGRSYYLTDEVQENYQHTPISRFGIGFLSCLTVARRIEATTRPHTADEGLRLIYRKESSVIAAERCADAARGTQVKLWIAPEEQRTGWNEAPVWGDPKGTYEERARQELMRMLCVPDGSEPLAAAARQWAIWPEMCIVIDGAAWGPRSISNDLRPLETGEHWTAVEVLVDGHLALSGAVICELLASSLPDVGFGSTDLTSSSAQGSAGHVLVSAETSLSPFVVFDIANAPARSLTAGRDWADHFLRGVLGLVGWAWQPWVLSRLAETPGWESIWMLIAEEDEILPVRRGGQVSFEVWDFERTKHEPCLLVPLLAPVVLDLCHALPIVGVPLYWLGFEERVDMIERMACVCLDEIRAACPCPSLVPDLDTIHPKDTYLLGEWLGWDESRGHFVRHEEGSRAPEALSQWGLWDEFGHAHGFASSGKVIAALGPPPEVPSGGRLTIRISADDWDGLWEGRFDTPEEEFPEFEWEWTPGEESQGE